MKRKYSTMRRTQKKTKPSRYNCFAIGRFTSLGLSKALYTVVPKTISSNRTWLWLSENIPKKKDQKPYTRYPQPLQVYLVISQDAGLDERVVLQPGCAYLLKSAMMPSCNRVPVRKEGINVRTTPVATQVVTEKVATCVTTKTRRVHPTRDVRRFHRTQSRRSTMTIKP